MQPPADFIQQLQQLIGNETSDFIDALRQPPVLSLRVNPFKASISTQPSDERLKPIPWASQGFYVTGERPFFTADPRLYAGAYYVQEASSMFLETIIAQYYQNYIPVLALDMCAAPGGKTTILASNLPHGSWVMANEPIGQRTAILSENVQKWGTGNIMVLQNQPADIAKVLPRTFDFVLVDAPCSGEGLFRKMPEIAQEWTLRQVEGCALRQRNILESAWAALNQGGLLVYSTCTFNRLENEENLLWLMQQDDAQCLRVDILPEWGITEREESGVYTYRFYPHKTDGEGFTVAVIRKGEPTEKYSRTKHKMPNPPKQWKKAGDEKDIKLRFDITGAADVWETPEKELVLIPTAFLPAIFLSLQYLKVQYPGLSLAHRTLKGIIPSAASALWTALPESNAFIAHWDLDYPQALKVLCQQPIDPPNNDADWFLARFGGWNLGYLKRVNNRLNNYLEKNWKIIASEEKLLEQADSVMWLPIRRLGYQ